MSLGPGGPVRMPEMDGLGATREITADPQLAATRVLVLTTFELQLVVMAYRSGVSS